MEPQCAGFVMGGAWESMDPPLSSPLLSALHALGFDRMTPVQAAVIPKLLTHKDVVVEAITGSGKTLAFAIPILELLRRREREWTRGEVGALVISPTRELAKQSANVLRSLSEKSEDGWSVLELVGGTKMDEDVVAFRERGGTILVGTPGRVEYFLQSVKDVKIKGLEILVLDEADRLLDLGFERQLSGILACLPKQRRTGLFSATQTKSVEEVVRAGLRNPFRVTVKTVAKEMVPETLKNYYTVVEAEQKLNQLVHFVNEQMRVGCKMIVFMLTCASVDYIAMVLPLLVKEGGWMGGLHGRMPQKRRKSVLDAFRSCDGAGTLVCTDVAARGLDFDDVDWIVQADPPQDPSVFVHRVGRTARLGRKGQALVYLLGNEVAYLDYLRLKNVPIEERAQDKDVPDVLDIVRGAARRDRAVMEKAHVAFVSFVRAYRENRLPYIFRLAELELGKVAMGYGLLSLPKMPELKNKQVQGSFVPPFADVDVSTIPYADKKREKARQERLAKQKASVQVKRNRESSWSKSKEKKDKRLSRREARKKKKMAKKDDIQVVDEEEEEDELAALAKEARLLKKLKKGKITEEEFERLVAESEAKKE